MTLSRKKYLEKEIAVLEKSRRKNCVFSRISVEKHKYRKSLNCARNSLAFVKPVSEFLPKFHTLF